MKVLLVLLAALGAAIPATGQTGAPRAPEAATGPAAQGFDPIGEAYAQFLMAQRYEEDANVAETIAAYKRAMTLDPKSAAIAAALAGFYMRQDRTSDAMTTAEQALKIDADNAEGHRVMGTLYTTLASQAEGDSRQRDALRENVARAIVHLEASIASPTVIADVNTRAMLSRLYVTAEQYDKAIAILVDLVKDEPGWQDGATLLVQAYTAAGRGDEAQAFLESAAPGNPRLYQQLAEFYGRRNQWQEASEAYVQALQASPRNNFDLKVGYASSLMNIGGVRNAMKARDQLREALLTRVTDQRAIYLLAEAERLAGDLDASETTARHLIELNRNSTRGYVALAETLEERQRYQAVVDLLAPVVEGFRSSASSAASLGALLPHLGFALQELGKTGDAVKVFEENVKLSPADAGALRQLGEAQLAAKDYAAAAQTAHAARATRPDDLRLARLEAQALRQAGKVDQGLALLQEIVQRRADDPAAYIILAQGYSDANRGPQAVQLLRDAQARFPGESSIAFELGAEFDRQKKFADAEAAFRQLIAREPENAAALNYLGYLLADRGERLDESVSLVQRALNVEPENGSYLDSLGWAYYKAGQLDLAEAPLRRAANLMATNSVVQDHFGDLLFKLGRYDEAVSAWTRALAGQGNSIDRADIDKKIKAAREKLPKK